MRLSSNHYLNLAAWVLLVGSTVCFAAGLGVGSVVGGLVLFGDQSHLKKTTILSRINEETTVFCLDEKTRLGSFFNSEHRRYVSIDEIPRHMIHAIIAAEDKNFYKHIGVDPAAIFSAVIEGFRTGRFRGGSTLTQQTVKNIMSDWEYSLRRKIKEAVSSLQMERLYSKKEILEFYLNQFHVSGNGTGIGIAAKHYFNKDVKDLELVESAFIAGSVKGPSKYDPFLKYTKTDRDRAAREAFTRKNYVLKRMFEQGLITKEEFQENFAKPVPFSRGAFGSSEVALVNLVKSQLGRKEILEQLKIDNADELNRAGLRVFTTIDCQMQSDAQLAMRRNLSRLETILSGFAPEKQENFKRLRDLSLNQFYFGKVEDVKRDPKDPSIKVSFGLSTGVIPGDAIMRYAKLMDLPIQEGFASQTKKLLNAIRTGDILFVEVRSYDSVKHEAILELHKRPKINGALVALDKGDVRVAVSGFDTLGYNRAIFARRQPGSVFKSVVFFAAQNLGWNILDTIDNERQLFPYQNRFYFPRPDHVSPYKRVSMIYAGTTSENLASVSLAYRLLEKINFDQFKQLLAALDLMPHAGEAAPDFHMRIQRALGVQLDNEGVREWQLKNAIADLLPDLIFSGQQTAIKALDKMWWGRGYNSELGRLYAREGHDFPPLEQAVRIELVRNNFLRLNEMTKKLDADWQLLASRIGQVGADAALSDAIARPLLAKFRVLPTARAKPALGYFGTADGERDTAGNSHLEYIERLMGVQGRTLSGLDVQMIWGAMGNNAVELAEVRVNGTIPYGAMTRLREAVDARFDGAMKTTSDFDLYRFFQHHDMRVAVGLNYLVHVAKTLGVSSPLEPVLSFPLGTNVVTAAEVAKIYQTFIDGKVYRFYDQGGDNQLNFIRRIESRSGDKLYEAQRKEYQVAQPEYAVQMKEILKRVVTHGTGKRARGELFVTLKDKIAKDTNATASADKSDTLRIQAFGKTGTTNDYHNAYFAGFFPYPTQKGQPLNISDSLAISSYVGYDISKMMKRGGMRITGGLGGLPVWTDFAKSLIESQKYADFADNLDLSALKKHEWPFAASDANLSNFHVDLTRGIILGGGGNNDDEVYGTTNIGKTGESYENEFQIGSTVNTVLRIPGDGKGNVARIFSPVVSAKSKADAVVSKIDAGEIPAVKSDAAVAPIKGEEPKIESSGVKNTIPQVPEIVDDDGRIIDQATDKATEEKAPDKIDDKKPEAFQEEDLWH